MGVRGSHLPARGTAKPELGCKRVLDPEADDALESPPFLPLSRGRRPSFVIFWVSVGGNGVLCGLGEVSSNFLSVSLVLNRFLLELGGAEAVVVGAGLLGLCGSSTIGVVNWKFSSNSGELGNVGLGLFNARR